MKTIFLALTLALAAAPSPAWQQRVAYDIEAKLDTVKHGLTAVQRLRYWNNSPDTLDFVWFHLYPNAYRDLSTDLAREAEQYHDYRGRRLRDADWGNIDISSFAAGGQPVKLSYNRDATEARAVLPRPLAPGDSVDFDCSYAVKLPKLLSRLGHVGSHYEISQWYPKMVVYDSKGWHPDGYHYLGEFYGDFGSFQVGITVPRGMKVGSTGVEVGDEPDSAAAPGDSTDYRLFCAEDVHDFAWCADATYLDTTEIHDGVAIRVLTLPKHQKKWRNVMQYARDALYYYGKWYGAYPYSTLTVCDGSMAAGGGMEYPNLVIISAGEDKQTRSLEMTVMHEIGHQWFYGMLGNDEMAEAWLDEGINSFSEERYFEEKYGPLGNYLVKPRARRMLPELTDRYIGQMFYYMFAANKMEQPVLTRASQVREPALYASLAYKKPAMLLWWLKGYLGDGQFDHLMQAYVARYRFRHVTGADFLALADSAAGSPVSQYFDPWLTTVRTCDQRIAAVRRVPGHDDLYAIQVVQDGLRMPTVLSVADRKNNVTTIPWNGADSVMWFMVRTEAGFKRAVLDPSRWVPDIDRFNNHWPRKIAFTLLPRMPSFDKYQAFAVPLPWYDAINGFRLGPFIHGGYLLDGGPMVGRHQWTAVPYYGFKSREVSFSFDYQTPVSSLPMPPRAYLTLGKGYDLRWAGLGVRRSWGRALMAPTESFDARLDWNRVVRYDRFWDPRDIQPGSYVTATVFRGSLLSGYRFGARTGLTASAGFLPNSDSTANNFFRAELEERLYLRPHRYVQVNLRGLFGYIQGPAPVQERYFLSGSFKAAGLDNVVVSGTGWFSAQENYHIDGGANVPGYLGRHISGRKVAALNLSLPLPLSKVPVSLFADAGLVVDDFQHFAIKNTCCDAGLSVSLGMVRALFPVWINRPLEGEKRFDFRWKVGLGNFSVSL